MLYQCITRYTTAWQPESNDTENLQLLEREFLKVHNTKYLSVKCAVLMHLSSAGEYLRYKYLDTYLRYLKSILYFVSKYIFKHVSCISIKDTFTVYFVSFCCYQIQILCTAAQLI